MSLMEIMDRTGHTEVNWDEDDRASVQIARETFERYTGEGYQAFRLNKTGGQGTRMTTFDPSAEALILVPQLQGG